MTEERIQKLSPEEKQRRIQQRRKKKKINAIINISFFSVTLICAVVFIIYLVNYCRYAIPNNGADSEIKAAKTAISEAETKISENSAEKESLEKAVSDLKTELEKYNDD